MGIASGEHPKTGGVNHGEASASHREQQAHAHGTHDPQAAAHGESDRKAMGHAAKGPAGAKGCFFKKG